MFKKIILPNGLRIILIPQKNASAATALVLVGTGSKYEKKEISGISHFLEHLFFKGTSKNPRPIDISEPLDRIGGIYNAFTGEEYTGYFVKADSKHLDLALDMLSDVYLNSKIDPAEIEKERGVIIEEINMIYDNPGHYVQVLWPELLYGDQPAGWNIAGTKESVSKISRQNIVDYLKSQYVAANTVVCVAGGIADMEQILEKIKKYFSKIKDSNYSKKPPVLETQKSPGLLVRYKETDQTHLCIGVRAYNMFHPKKYAQEVLALVLGGMMSSRLFIRIREELGLAYYISAVSSADTDNGSLFAQAGVDNTKIEKAISAILEEFRKIKDDVVPESELDKAKDNIKGKMALLLETSDSQASFYGMQEMLEKTILTPEEICDKIDEVKAQDLQEVARDIFQPKNLNLALIGPFKDEDKFKKILKL